MAQRRWLIAVGALVLAGMLLCAAFSLGVYAGKHGLSGDALRTGQEVEPLVRLRDELGRPDLLGRIRRATPEGIELATGEGPRSVQVNAETQFFDQGGVAMRVTDLHPGDLVAVYGELNGVAGRAFTARVVVRIPPQPAAAP